MSAEVELHADTRPSALADLSGSMGLSLLLKKGSNSETARRNVAVLSCLCPRGQNNNLEWLRNNLIQNRTSHFPAFFSLQTHPLLHTAPQKKKKKNSLSSDNPAAEADVSYLQQLLNPQTLCWSFDLPFRGWAEAWRAPSKQAQVAVSQTHTGCSPVHDIPPSLPPPSPLTRSVSIAYFCSLPLECQASQSERSRTTGHRLSTLRPPPLMTHVI